MILLGTNHVAFNTRINLTIGLSFAMFLREKVRLTRTVHIEHVHRACWGEKVSL
jgi:hypothetical protein